jgi:hypothetical protein
MGALRIVCASLALATLAVLPSCSLLDLDGFAVLSCDRGTDCEPINQRDAIPADACTRWVCHRDAHTCFLGTRDDDGDTQSPPTCGGTDCDDDDPRRSLIELETCDGVDNDCNLAIDDLPDAQPGTGTSPLIESLDVVAMIANGRGARYGASGATHAAVMLAALSTGGELEPPENGSLVLLDGPAEGTPTELGHARSADTMFSTTALVDGCPTDALGASEVCNEADAALAGNGARWVVAAVSTNRCRTAGQLRIASLVSSTDVRLRHQGPTSRSHVWLGVGADAATGCTVSPGGGVGARAPALSSLRDRELLAAYLADAPGESCDDENDVEVDALGLWLSDTPGLSWVDATGSGVPTPMGTTRSFGGPSIVAWPDQGWLLAFGEASGGIALRFVEPLPPAPLTPVEGVVNETAPLARVDLPTIGTMDVERVSIALGHVDGDTAEIGIVLQEGCEARVHFVRVLVDLVARTAIELGASIDLGVARDPAIAYVASGMRVDADRPSGFVVLYVAPGDAGAFELRAARISDGTGELVGTPFTLGPATSSPHLYEAEAEQQLRFAYQDGDRLMGGTLFCPPAPLP